MCLYVPVVMLKLNTTSVQRSDTGLTTEDITPSPAITVTRYDVPPCKSPPGIVNTIDITPSEVKDSFKEPTPDEHTW